MRARVLTHSAFLFSFGLAGPLGAQAPPRTVRVSTIGHLGTPRSLVVAAGGAWRLIDLGDRHRVCEGSSGARWQFVPSRGGRVVAQGERHQWEAAGFRLESAAPEQTFTVGEGRRALVYPGAVEVSAVHTRSGIGLRLINEALLEQYLCGVVTAEGSASFQPEALKALAIAARSYAERNRLRHAPEGEMCDTVHCQVYPGVGRVPEKVARAVAETAGVVGLSGGEVIDAVYSADCGGRTRNSEEVWPQRNAIPYLRSVEDRPPSGGPDYCAVYRNHVLRLKLTPMQVGRLLGLRNNLAAPLGLAGVERDGSGRVSALRLAVGGQGDGATGARETPPARQQVVEVTPDGDELLPCELLEARSPGAGPDVAAGAAGARLLTFSQLRRTVGDQLRGRLVDAVPSPDGGLELECRGLGHGVGLCQWGAQGMALPPYNHTCEEILRHYYSGISLGSIPARTARLLLQLAGDGGQALADVSIRLLPGDLSGTTDGQGRWEAPAVPTGTYTVEARRGGETTTFYAVRVAAGKNSDTRVALVWRTRDDRVARVRNGAEGG